MSAMMMLSFLEGGNGGGIDSGIGILIFLIPSLSVIGIFTYLSIASWATQRRLEREAYYRHEVEKHLVEKDALPIERLAELRAAEDAERARRRRERLKLAGLITAAVGAGLLIALADTDEKPARGIGWVFLLIGVAILGFAFTLRVATPSGAAERGKAGG